MSDQTREVKARPIIFGSDMVRALIAGRKTQTRRVMKPAFPGRQIVNLKAHGDIVSLRECSGQFNDPMSWGYPYAEDGVDMAIGQWPELCPYGQPGDLLYVRETFAQGATRMMYRAECNASYVPHHGWRPSIHMPRWGSRLTLRITDVRVERVQKISYSDAVSEGMYGNYMGIGETQKKDWRGTKRGLSSISQFRELWDSINTKRGHGWGANPWVWVIDFEAIQANVDDVIAGLGEEHLID